LNNTVLYFRRNLSKRADLSDVSKPLKLQEKKDALANIDLNNIAGNSSQMFDHIQSVI